MKRERQYNKLILGEGNNEEFGIHSEATNAMSRLVD